MVRPGVSRGISAQVSPRSRRAAQEAVGIDHGKGKADDGGDRSERDVALVEVEPEAQDFAAFEGAATDDAGAAARRGIAAGVRFRQCETGNFVAAGEAREVVVALGGRAVVKEKLGGT